MVRKQLNKEIQKITQQLVQKYKPERIIVFGSVVSGTFGSHSDIDLLIIKEGVEKIKRHKRYYEVRKLMDTDMAVDLLVYAPYEVEKRVYLNDPFVKNILRKGKVLYGA